MGQEWQRVSKGQVLVRIYPGGVMGDEVEMQKKVGINQLQAVALSGAGLSHLDPGVGALQIPMLIQSYAELDAIRERLAPKLEARIDAKKFVVLNWADVGWIHFFSKRPARTLDDIRGMKLFTSAGDPESEALFKELGFKPVPLAVTDMLTSLQTGMIEAYDVPPLFAMLDQSFGLAKNMIDIKWAPLIGATIISKDSWNKIPEALRPQLMAVARKSGDAQRERIRKMGDDAVLEMQKRGLNVVRADAALQAKWHADAELVYPKMRGRLVPPDLFDEVVRLRDEYRKNAAGK
jgi:TRAP-type C4-dicarboxylate transport system substrate-binding protein